MTEAEVPVRAGGRRRRVEWYRRRRVLALAGPGCTRWALPPSGHVVGPDGYTIESQPPTDAHEHSLSRRRPGNPNFSSPVQSTGDFTPTPGVPERESASL